MQANLKEKHIQPEFLIGNPATNFLPEDDFYLGERFEVDVFIARLESNAEKIYEQVITLRAGEFSNAQQKAEHLTFVHSNFRTQISKLGDFYALLNEGFAVREKDNTRLDRVRIQFEKIRGLLAYELNDVNALAEVDVTSIEAKRFSDRNERTQKLQQFFAKKPQQKPGLAVEDDTAEQMRLIERARYIAEKKRQAELVTKTAWLETKERFKRAALITLICCIPVGYFFFGQGSPTSRVAVDTLPFKPAIDVQAAYQKGATLMIVVNPDWAGLYTREKEVQMRKLAKLAPHKHVVIVDPNESLLAENRRGHLSFY